MVQILANAMASANKIHNLLLLDRDFMAPAARRARLSKSKKLLVKDNRLD